MKIKVEKIHYKPTIEFREISILDRTYLERIVSPNLYLLELKKASKLKNGDYEKISFVYENTIFELETCEVENVGNNKVLINCCTYVEEYNEDGI